MTFLTIEILELRIFLRVYFCKVLYNVLYSFQFKKLILKLITLQIQPIKSDEM